MVAGVLIIVAGIYINYITLSKAYGAGPPYSGQTTKMDKWSAPMTFLAVLDIVAIVVLSGLGWICLLLKNSLWTS